MKEDNDIFKKFRDSFSKIDGHFHILEQRVPVERQMEYFKYSEKIRKDQDKPDISKMDFSVFEDSLDDPESTTEHKKYVLSMLATSRQVKAYRILEEYAQAPDPDVADWAYMALMESRIALESELSDEKQIYISTGLGGRGEKLRFYVLILANELKPFLEYQKKVIEREFPYSLENADCEIERLTIGEKHMELELARKNLAAYERLAVETKKTDIHNLIVAELGELSNLALGNSENHYVNGLLGENTNPKGTYVIEFDNWVANVNAAWKSHYNDNSAESCQTREDNFKEDYTDICEKI